MLGLPTSKIILCTFASYFRGSILSNCDLCISKVDRVIVQARGSFYLPVKTLKPIFWVLCMETRRAYSFLLCSVVSGVVLWFSLFQLINLAISGTNCIRNSQGTSQAFHK